MGDSISWGVNLDWEIKRENLEHELKEVFPIRKPSDYQTQKPLTIPTVAEVSVSAGEVRLQDEIPGLGRVSVYTKGPDGITIHTTMGHVLKFEPGYETKILVRRTA